MRVHFSFREWAREEEKVSNAPLIRILITIIWNTITNDQPLVDVVAFFLSLVFMVHRFVPMTMTTAPATPRRKILIKYVLYHTEKWYGNDSSYQNSVILLDASRSLSHSFRSIKRSDPINTKHKRWTSKCNQREKKRQKQRNTFITHLSKAGTIWHSFVYTVVRLSDSSHRFRMSSIVCLFIFLAQIERAAQPQIRIGFQSVVKTMFRLSYLCWSINVEHNAIERRRRNASRVSLRTLVNAI